MANTFKGGTRDHYGLVPDATPDECNYWRRLYGIHLIPYPTTIKPDGSRDHGALLSTLNSLTRKDAQNSAPSTEVLDQDLSSKLLALARHASALSRAQKNSPEFLIRVQAAVKGKRPFDLAMDSYHHAPVQTFLDSFPNNAILIGLPGSGKSYSLKQAAARSSDLLYEACLAEPQDQKNIVVPILIDLKLYGGSLKDLVNKNLPATLPLEEIKRKFKARIFLDSFNEMPKEYLENASYESDFTTFINELGETPLFIGSRTTDGLDKFDLATYHLSLIDEKTIESETNRIGLSTEGRFEREIKSLLQRPFYFRYILSGEITLPANAHPRDFYKTYFRNVASKFHEKFGFHMDIERALSRSAYEALNQGEEAFPLASLTRVLRAHIATENGANTNSSEIANWLISNSTLTPYSGGRIAFIHQSITEYLAATELADQYQKVPRILKEKIRLTRWDQALFLTLSLLPDALADAFFEDVLLSDFKLAATAVKFIEVNQEERVSRIIDEIIARAKNLRGRDMHELAFIFKSGMPFTEKHTPALWKLIAEGDLIGGYAVEAITRIKGLKIKDQLLQMLFDKRDDYNLCANGIAPAIREFAHEDDAQKIKSWARRIDSAEKSSHKDADGFISGGARTLSNLRLSKILEIFPPEEIPASSNSAQTRILCQILQSLHTTEALEAAASLVLRGVGGAATTIYFISNFAKNHEKLEWSCFNRAHVEALLSAILQKEAPSGWSLKALTKLCAARADLAEIVLEAARSCEGIGKAALLLSIAPNHQEQAFKALESLTKMNLAQLSNQPIHLINEIELDWKANNLLFVALLALRNNDIASQLIRSVPPNVKGMGKVHLSPVEWWLEWIEENMKTNKWLSETLCGFLAEYSTTETQAEIISIFNDSKTQYRDTLHQCLLPKLTGLSTDDLSPDAISFVLSSISKSQYRNFFGGSFLGQAATESFVSERILPLLSGAEPDFSVELKRVLKEAGARHGKRYTLDSDD